MLIRGGRVVDVDGDRIADVRTGPDGTITAVGPALDALPREDVLDATGRLVVPGGVDAHVHLALRMGELRVAHDVATTTAAAAAGGTTTVLEAIQVPEGRCVHDAVVAWRSRTSDAAVDHGFQLSVSAPVDGAELGAAVEGGAVAFDVSTVDGHTRGVDDGVVLDVLRAGARHGVPVSVHAENGPAISSLRRAAIAAGRRDPSEHGRTRPAVLEGESISRVAMLAEMAEAPLYVSHVSSAPALEAVRRAQERGLSVTAETCPQYLHLSDDLLVGPDGDAFVCSPPLREPWHAEELWYGIAAGWIHAVATDHCAWTRDDRRRGTAGRSGGRADFTEIPVGLVGVETRLALVWAGVVEGRLRASDWVRLCAEAPARAFGLWPRKGSLRVGADADVVVWDPLTDRRLDLGELLLPVDHAPYEGTTSHGWAEVVLLRGDVVARDGRFVGAPGGGRFTRATATTA